MVIVVPDARDLDRVDGALTAELGPAAHVILSASLGPAERYRRWLAAERGQVRVVAGTRSAMFAPVRGPRPGGALGRGRRPASPSRARPTRTPARCWRCGRTGPARRALIGGFARTAEAAQLMTGGWARPLAADRATRAAVRRPAVAAAGDDCELARDEAARSARLPGLALRTAREALAAGPVLFQVPRRGYLAAVACERCHAPGAVPAAAAPRSCRGARGCRAAAGAAAPSTAAAPGAGTDGLRALVTGATRTAEELGRAFPAVPVRTSGGSRVLAQVPGTPAVVVATPGAEPCADGGYAAAMLLDGWALLGRASLRAAEETAAPVDERGGAGPPRPGRGQRGGRRRREPARGAGADPLGSGDVRRPRAGGAPRAPLPAGGPDGGAVRAAQTRSGRCWTRAELPAGGRDTRAGAGAGSDPGPRRARRPRPRGPARTPMPSAFLVRAPRSGGAALAAVLHAGQAARTARKEPGTVRLELDPAELI